MSDREFRRQSLALRKRLRQQHQATPSAIAAAVYGAAQGIMRRARQNAPVLEGWLRSGGYVARPEQVTPGISIITMGFDGPAEEYLVVQHETNRNGGRFFFLRALQSEQTAARLYINNYMRDFLRTSVVPFPAKTVPTDPHEEMGWVKLSRHGRHG